MFFSWNYLVWDEMHHCRILLPNTTTGYINIFIVDTAFHWVLFLKERSQREKHVPKNEIFWKFKIFWILILKDNPYNRIFIFDLVIPLYTSWMCFNTFPNYVWIILTPATGLITLVGAIDRFISIMFPLRYFKLTTTYSYIMISLPILSILPILIIGGIQSYDGREQYNVIILTIFY